MSPFEPLSQTDARTKLAARRVARSVTQRQMWEAEGVSCATYIHLEQGRMANPPLRLLVNCAIALSCELGDVIENSWLGWFTRPGYMPTSRRSSTLGAESAAARDPEANIGSLCCSEEGSMHGEPARHLTPHRTTGCSHKSTTVGRNVCGRKRGLPRRSWDPMSSQLPQTLPTLATLEAFELPRVAAEHITGPVSRHIAAHGLPRATEFSDDSDLMNPRWGRSAHEALPRAVGTAARGDQARVRRGGPARLRGRRLGARGSPSSR
jgi:transcriptional regulator with XRE-family HTH domain